MMPRQCNVPDVTLLALLQILSRKSVTMSAF